MRIGIVAPARNIDHALAGRLVALAAALRPGVELVIHPQCYLSDGHFAGDDAARAAALIDVANDPAIDAVWFARGGYGSNRIVAMVMDKLGPAARDKAWLGYSDTGFLLAALYAAGIGRPAHGPMPADLARADGEAAVARALDWLAAGEKGALDAGIDGHPHAAFNLTILAGLIGTRWLPDLAGHVLAIEEVAEPLYRIDRLLCQVARAGQLRGIAGIRLGRISDVVANDPPWGETLDTMVNRWCAEMGVPFLGTANIGHDGQNRIIPFGPC